MERKIGKIFEENGEWYQCIEVGQSCCSDCSFNKLNKVCHLMRCSLITRSDEKCVIFKKLEKVGEPYEFDGHLFQSYRTFEVPIFTENYATIREFGNNSKISIEIKQNKEDMEEKKLNLKPFDIQKAREGKPVCTRDGRSVRIICFDQKDITPIVGLVTGLDGKESIYAFYKDGRVSCQEERVDDLMMLPEKRSGWVNVYKDSVYDTKGEALIGRSGRGYIDTIKIYWEE